MELYREPIGWGSYFYPGYGFERTRPPGRVSASLYDKPMRNKKRGAGYTKRRVSARNGKRSSRH